MQLFTIVEPADDQEPGWIRALNDEAQVLARVDRRNILANSASSPFRTTPSDVLIWSGSLNKDLEAVDTRNWLGSGRTALERWLADAAELLRASDSRVLIQPHAHHVLSDVPGCAWFCREYCTSGQFGLAISPATMLTTEMLSDLEDHLVRIFEVFGSLARCIILEDVQPDESASLPKKAPLGQGVLPRELVRQLLDDHVTPDVPVVLTHEVIEVQQEWLAP